MFKTKITDAEARTFTLAAVISSAGAWDIAFHFGAFGTVFYTKIFFIWSVSIALFWVSIFLPEKLSPVTWWGRLLLILPTVWMILALINVRSETSHLEMVMEVMGISTFALCLPYALWVVTQITQPTFFELRSRQLIVAIVVIILTVTTIGYLAGRFNFVILSCEDFQVAGADIPENCGNPPVDMDFFD